MRIPVGDAAFDNVTMAEAVQQIVDMTQSRANGMQLVCTGNLDHLVLLSRDPDFQQVYQDADLILADGAPVVWLSKLSARRTGKALTERVAGSDLFWELARESATNGLRLFFLGGSEGAADRAAAAVVARHPDAVICGTYCPPFKTFASPDEQARIRDVINAQRPDILLVALGAPKQEKWIAQNRNQIDAAVGIGVGGSFEMAAGDVRRAPVWMRNTGTEWLYRFLQEPSRLWDRYFKNDLPFLIRLAVKTAIGPQQPVTSNLK